MDYHDGHKTIKTVSQLAPLLSLHCTSECRCCWNTTKATTRFLPRFPVVTVVCHLAPALGLRDRDNLRFGATLSCFFPLILFSQSIKGPPRGQQQHSQPRPTKKDKYLSKNSDKMLSAGSPTKQKRKCQPRVVRAEMASVPFRPGGLVW